MMNDIWIPQTRASLGADKLDELTAVLNRIPELPVSVKRIVEMAGDAETDPKDLSAVASTDPALVSRILVMVNSTYYGLARKIENLRLAIVLLGFNEVRKIAIQCGFMNVLGSTSQESLRHIRELWRHSYIVSVFAESFAPDDDPQRSGVLATLGILHDIGKAALETMNNMLQKHNMGASYMDGALSNEYLLQHEERLFGVNHALAGALLAEKWNLSNRIVTVLECHHHPSFFGVNEIPSDHIEDIAAVSIADLMVSRMENGGNDLPEPHPIFLEMLGHSGTLDSLITAEVLDKYEHNREFVEAMF